MMVPDHPKTAAGRLDLASVYLLLTLMSSSWLLQGSPGYVGSAVTVVDSGQICAGLEEDLDAHSPAAVVLALPLFAAPVARQQTDIRRRRHSVSLRLIRAPPGRFS